MDRIGYIISFVADLEASIAFYRDVLGLPYRFTDAGYAEFGTAGIRFPLYERRRAEWLTGQSVRSGPAAEIGLMIRDVDSHARRLADQGVTVLSGPADRPWGHRTVHIADPDGFVVELAQEVPRQRSSATGSG